MTPLPVESEMFRTGAAQGGNQNELEGDDAEGKQTNRQLGRERDLGPGERPQAGTLKVGS